MAYSFVQLADNWGSLTDAQKKSLFDGTGYRKATIDELRTLGDFKVLYYSDYETPSNNKVEISAVPVNKLALPTSLFGDSFDSIINIKLTENISDIINAKIRYAVTKDLNEYYVFSGGSWLKLSTVTADEVIANGMSSTQIYNITQEQWKLFYDSTIDENGIGVCYAFSESATSQVTEIDNLEVTVNLKGSWEKADHKADYTYGYSGNKTLTVNLLTDGDYKINYAKSNNVGGGGGGGEASKPKIEEWKQNTSYEVGEVVEYSGEVYRCITTHNSGTSFTKANWEQLTSDITSAKIQSLFL